MRIFPMFCATYQFDKSIYEKLPVNIVKEMSEAARGEIQKIAKSSPRIVFKVKKFSWYRIYADVFMKNKDGQLLKERVWQKYEKIPCTSGLAPFVKEAIQLLNIAAKEDPRVV